MTAKTILGESTGSYEKSLVYVSRLTKPESQCAHELEDAFPGIGQAKAVRDVAIDVKYDRLIQASGFIEVAKKLAPSPGRANNDEFDARTAISRAYYAIHHAMRAMILHEFGYEEDGHSSSIKALNGLLTGKSFRDRSGLAEKVIAEIAEARTNREIADYSPYDMSRNETEKEGCLGW